MVYSFGVWWVVRGRRRGKGRGEEGAAEHEKETAVLDSQQPGSMSF
jgi:hypothetical protein